MVMECENFDAITQLTNKIQHKETSQRNWNVSHQLTTLQFTYHHDVTSFVASLFSDQ